jgi:hypothetical protein
LEFSAKGTAWVNVFALVARSVRVRYAKVCFGHVHIDNNRMEERFRPTKVGLQHLHAQRGFDVAEEKLNLPPVLTHMPSRLYIRPVASAYPRWNLTPRICDIAQMPQYATPGKPFDSTTTSMY